MRSARSLLSGKAAAWGGVAHVTYQQPELNLAAQVLQCPQLLAMAGEAAPTCVSALDITDFEFDGKAIGIGDWALCDWPCTAGPAWLIFIQRIVQFNFKDSDLSRCSAVAGKDNEDYEEEIDIRTRMVVQHYVPGLQPDPNRGGELAISNLNLENSAHMADRIINCEDVVLTMLTWSSQEGCTPFTRRAR